MKRVIAFISVFILITVSAVSVSAVDYGCTVEPTAKAVYFENLDTGAVIYQKSADQQMYPASTTKIMTYAVVADNVSDFDNTMVVIKEEVLVGLDPESTVMGASEHIGESISVRDLLYGLMLPSGNDAALILADYVGGGIDGFVDKMNAKAAELGCTNTHFANPHGLYDPDHYTTAQDLAKITKYAMTTQSFMDICNTVEYTPDNFSNTLHNTNYMLSPKLEGGIYYYPFTKGIKTGYLDEAGKCLVTTADNGSFKYLCVELGTDYSFAEDINYAMLDAAKMYEWAFSELSSRTVYGPNDTVKTVPVKFAVADREAVGIPEKEIMALLPNNYNKDLIKVDINCVDELQAPVAKGDVLGTVTVYYDDLNLGTTNVVAAEEVELNRIKFRLAQTGEFFKNNIILIVLIVAAVIGVIILLAVLGAHRKKRARARRREQSRHRFRD